MINGASKQYLWVKDGPFFILKRESTGFLLESQLKWKIFAKITKKGKRTTKLRANGMKRESVNKKLHLWLYSEFSLLAVRPFDINTHK